MLHEFFSSAADTVRSILGRGSAVQPLPHDQAEAIAAHAASHGLASLPDALLIERGRLQQRYLAATDVTTCAAIARGEAHEEVVRRALLTLDRPSLDRWIAIQWLAVRAGLLETATDSLRHDVDSALAPVFQALNEREVARMAALARIGFADPRETCWLGRRLLGGALSLEPAPSARALRALSAPAQ